MFNQNGQLIYRENKRPNLLHYEGEQYILSAAFNTALEFAVPPVLYIGIDSRNKLTPKDTLATVTKSEMKGASYSRIPIATGGGFIPSWEKALVVEGKTDDPVFVLNATATFTAKGEDMGQVKNYFLATVAEGSNGLLLVSSSLRKPFDLDKGYKLTVGMSVSLREAKLED